MPFPTMTADDRDHLREVVKRISSAASADIFTDAPECAEQITELSDDVNALVRQVTAALAEPLHLYLYRNADDTGEYGIIRAASVEEAAAALVPRFSELYGADMHAVQFQRYDDTGAPGALAFVEEEGQRVITVFSVTPSKAP